MDTFSNSYIAGFCDGDGTICIGRCNGGFQLKVEFTQCNIKFIHRLNEVLGGDGKIYVDSRNDKYNNENACGLRFCGKKAVNLLTIMQDYAIIKSNQATLALSFINYINQPGTYEIKNEICEKMKQMNADKSTYDKPYNRICDAYIAGLFDAEGNIYFKEENGKVKKYYVKITQKCDPLLILHMQTYLAFGKISPCEPFRLRFMSKADIRLFCAKIEDFSIIKLERLLYLTKRL